MLRESKVIEQMELLGITDVTTPRQSKNGTVVWRLPIKNKWNNGSYIEVGSFKTGYVRNQNSCYSNFQLNKRCESKPEYFELSNGDYRRFSTRSCVLIPREIDRLEYLIRYCLKNYYIKHANFVANGEYIPKWTHEWRLEQASKEEGFYSRQNDDLKRQLALLNGTNYSPKDVQVIIDGQRYKVI